MERIRANEWSHPEVERFLEALISFKAVDDGLLGFSLASNWENIIAEFKNKYITVQNEYFNTGKASSLD